MLSSIKSLIRKLIGDSRLGWLDYFRSSDADRNWSGPFNGQHFREKMFNAILLNISPAFIVETGTFRGVTTEYFAQSSEVSVFSIESNARNFGFASARLRPVRDRVSIYLGDSVSVLKHLFSRRCLPDGRGFFYLDAHWYNHLPLREEVDLIFAHRPNSVVMIDDFQVPDDSGYGFDDYGDNGKIAQSYLVDAIRKLDLRVFFPNCESGAESGKKRGSVVLAKAPLAVLLRKLPEFRVIV